MPFTYSSEARAHDEHALPDIELFFINEAGYCDGRPFVLPHTPGEEALGLSLTGWYWWACFPGCLPDGEPNGPFEDEDEALADARDWGSR